MAEKADRKTDLSRRDKVREKLERLYETIEKAWTECTDRINGNLDFWDIFNCELGPSQFYTGNSQAFVPIVHDAVEARKTRFVNQIFPQSGRYVEVVTDDEELPSALLALVDHYVEFSRLRVDVLPALFKSGDIEGQYSVYVDWTERTRYVTRRVHKGPDIGDGDSLPASAVDEQDHIEDIEEVEVKDFGPVVEVIPDNDLIILPNIADTIDEVLYRYGGSVTILRRWSKAMIEKKMAEGVVDRDAGEELIERMRSAEKSNIRDEKKAMADAAGVKTAGKYALIYETWSVIEVDDRMRLTRTYFGGSDMILSCMLNPFWCDLCPVISVPVDKVSGSVKGISKIRAVAPLQYMANDFLNEGADSASYALMPIIATDPLSNPRVGSMVVDLGAVWEVDPNKTKFMEFPKLWQDALGLVQALTQQIFQTLSVNPSMIAQRSAAKKPTQAEIAAEQAIDILATADVIIPFEAGILTPMITRFVEYDSQFRREGLWVKAFGREGIKSQMQEVPPQQLGNRTSFKWWGVEQARSAQQIQQQISFMNVLKEIPQQMLEGRRIDMVPLIERAVESVFGPRLGPQVFKPVSDMIGMPPEEENQLLLQGNDLPVSPADDDREHLKVHMQAMQAAQGNPHALWAVKQHMFKHQQQMGLKNAAAAAQMQGGQPGQGGPRPGAQSQAPRGGQQPAGAVQRDQMPLSMPRKPA
jgi:hypothetical protein